MSKISEFVNYLEEQVKNHSIYVLGSQGEKVLELTPQWLEKMESSKRISEIMYLVGNHYLNKHDMSKAKCYDCSGLGVYYFLEKGYIKSDMTADMIYRSCNKIDYKDIRTGDFAFQVDSNGKMHHIGYICNIENNRYQIIEAKGRSYGVVKGDLVASQWTHYARPKFWDYSIDRTIYLTTPYMKGDDVKEVQKFLTRKGYFTNVIDGVYGELTASAVEKFQKAETKVLKVNYGKVNKNTALAMGFLWKE